MLFIACVVVALAYRRVLFKVEQTLMADRHRRQPRRRRYRRRRRASAAARLSRSLQWITLALVALFVLVPFYTTVLGGFKEIGELRVNPFGLPAELGSGPLHRHPDSAQSSSARWATRCSSRCRHGGRSRSCSSSMTAFAFAHIKFFGSRNI